jgi:GNAT superfamily N-acetyltransferase
MNLTIREVTPEDVPAVISMLRDFAAFEKLSEYCTVTEEQLGQAMFGPDGFVEGLIAFDDERPIAYALFYPHFSTFRGQRGVYLEDIYIMEAYRGKGVGDAMLKRLAKISGSRGCERIDFQVLNWNESAIRFYEKHGAARDDDERHFKYTDEAFERLAD